jgi:transposase-like protein
LSVTMKIVAKEACAATEPTNRELDHSEHSSDPHYCPMLMKEYPYLALIATYENNTNDKTMRPYAMLAGIGINRAGHQAVLGATAVDRQSYINWTIFLEGLRVRGLRGVEVVLTSGHGIQKRAAKGLFPDAHLQTCAADFRRRAIDTVLSELVGHQLARRLAPPG